MIVDRYDPVNLLQLVPPLQLEMEPELAALDRLQEDDVLFRHVKADLLRRYPQSAHNGRRSTPVEVILRTLAVQHLYDWSYEEAEHYVNDSLVLRQFTRVPAPSLIRLHLIAIMQVDGERSLIRDEGNCRRSPLWTIPGMRSFSWHCPDVPGSMPLLTGANEATVAEHVATRSTYQHHTEKARFMHPPPRPSSCA